MRRWLAPAFVYSAVAALILLPVVRRFGSVIPHDAGDPVLNGWILWWSTRHLPFTEAWWNAPMFYPMRNAMALSEVLVGLLPISAPVQALTGNPLAGYNAALLVSFPLCGLAARALALEIVRFGRQAPGARHQVAAFAAGLAYAFAPYRMGQFSHIQMMSYYWAPVALLALHRYLPQPTMSGGDEAPRPGVRWLVLFGFAWLMQSLSNGYAMFHLAVLIALWIVWFVRSRRELLSIAAAWAAASLPLVPMLVTYENVHRALHLVRDINEVKRFSVDLTEFLSPSPELFVWGGRLVAARGETALFPGVTVLVLAGIGIHTWRQRLARPMAPARLSRPAAVAAAIAIGAALVAGSVLLIGPWAIGRVVTVSVFHKPFSIALLAATVFAVQTAPFRRAWQGRSVPAFYLIAMIVMYVLALGPSPTVSQQPLLYEPPYAWLMRMPGFDVLRVPARFAMLAVLCQSMLAAIVVARASLIGDRRAAAWLVCAGLLVEGWIRLPVVPPPAIGRPDLGDAAAVLELRPGKPEVDFPAIYRSMFYGRPIVNGYSGYAPPHYLPLAHALRDGHYDAIGEVAAGGRIAVLIDNSSPDAADMASRVAALPRIEPHGAVGGWTLFVAPARPRPALPAGAPIGIVRVEANRHPEDVRRMMDGRVDTAWSSGAEQDGQETITVDLGSAHQIAAVVFRMGAFAFGFPRGLAVNASGDAASWSEVWRGETAVQTVRAALANPGDVPVTIGFAPVSARYLRLQQTGRETGIPWWIGDLQVLGPP